MKAILNRYRGSFIVGVLLGALLTIPIQYGEASDYPDVVELDALETLYEPATFDHEMHVDVGSCAACHHHTTGTPTEDKNCMECHKASGEADTVACADCHTYDLSNMDSFTTHTSTDKKYHLVTTGLKRAYHVNCMGCHEENGAPTGCEDCHIKK